ncbi:hypothetical protein GGTG_13631 [Gaeumannomyces tritici R3-111a-1]|uniref:Uncharacterized protein n=1 Tax=Gaeumannomyces tritici (strain R3-111a-1) TaxID=644352 RepID=J3PJF1_GAET3|nr:hypothetical protein GGTG_13631 [Gaeumannomyces tritici R3-111a-1]EJT68801.1 hypothetical protein GGTG_13631 [Gaeumannomyces tritici R3-111a-1]
MPALPPSSMSAPAKDKEWRAVTRCRVQRGGHHYDDRHREKWDTITSLIGRRHRTGLAQGFKKKTLEDLG